MKKQFSIWIVVSVLGLFILPLKAVLAETVGNVGAVDNAYELHEPVKDQSQAEWSAVVKQSLPQLLVKISGNQKIIEAKRLQESLAKPAKYVRSYNYTTQKAENGNLPLVLHLTFDEKAVNQLLQELTPLEAPTGQFQAQQSQGDELLAEVRPSSNSTETSQSAITATKKSPTTLVWLAVKTQDKAYVLSSNTENEVIHTLKAKAAKRDLPLVFPLMDLSDWSKISESDIAKLDPALLDEASKRYAPEIVFEGQLIQTQPHYWEGQWALNIRGENLRWNTEGESLDDVIDSALEDVSNNVKARLSSSDNIAKNAPLKIKIMGVEGLDDYAEVVSYLRSLAFISKVEVVDVGSDNVVVEIIPNTNPGNLENVDALLTQDNKLQSEIIANHETVSADISRVYRWVRQQPPELPVPGSDLENS